MKHIFLVHSHTLFLTAVGVIDRDKILSKDVIFIYSREYKCIYNLGYKSFDLSKEIEDTFYIMLSWSRRHFLVNKRNRDRSVTFFDQFVEENAGEGFYLYSSHLQAFASQILATNPKCKECFFIQEGGRVMTPDVNSHIKWFCRLYNSLFLKGEKRLWKMTNWFPNNKTPYNRPITVYAFDKGYFGSDPKEVRMVKWPKLNIDLQLDENRPIFLLEGAVELGQVEKRLYEKAVERLIEEYAKDNNYIKFHPKNTDEAKKEYRSYFVRRGLEVEELPMNVPFELILMKYKRLHLYGFGTSLLFYGKALGHEVISHEEYLMTSARYRTYVKGLQTLDEVCPME